MLVLPSGLLPVDAELLADATFGIQAAFERKNGIQRLLAQALGEGKLLFGLIASRCSVGGAKSLLEEGAEAFEDVRPLVRCDLANGDQCAPAKAVDAEKAPPERVQLGAVEASGVALRKGEHEGARQGELPGGGGWTIDLLIGVIEPQDAQ